MGNYMSSRIFSILFQSDDHNATRSVRTAGKEKRVVHMHFWKRFSKQPVVLCFEERPPHASTSP